MYKKTIRTVETGKNETYSTPLSKKRKEFLIHNMPFSYSENALFWVKLASNVSYFKVLSVGSSRHVLYVAQGELEINIVTRLIAV